MKVFLSYSSEDRAVAKQIASKLTKAGLKAWDRADAVLPGDNWGLEVGKALEQSKAMVVLISPKSVKSESVQHELQYALITSRFKGRVVPVLVKPTRDLPGILQRFPIVRVGQNLQKATREIVKLLKHGFELTPATS
ncbi:MAG: toll/interleukin-1 receptor domain-containing protein [Verrucomicrobia bacterium]|nr:MAG: toll/interleukin-1 receptor domain-containing protein [Verrucomicrobiota bacterium]